MKTVLIAPLNWGLGHATRCIPIIHILEKYNVKILLAGDGAALDLLQREFPHLETHELPPYNIRYARAGGLRLAFKLLWQLPNILKAIILEFFWLKKFLKNNDIDIVIADNRFGFFNRKVKCIFLTHQVAIQTPFWITTKCVNLVNHFFLSQFNQLWIPDFEGNINLSGRLSHGNFPKSITQKMRYISPLSRFEQKEVMTILYDLTIILSGLEPQRTILENLILAQLQKNKNLFKKVLFIRGSKSINKKITEPEYENIKFHDIATTHDLDKYLRASRLILCRSGYSTVMDLAALGVKAVLIPTPGQTEQEYLAEHLAEAQFFTFQKQEYLDLNKIRAENKPLKGIPTDLKPNIAILEKIIFECINY